MVPVIEKIDVTKLRPRNMLLQQPPFLFVDRILDFDEETLTCSKYLSHNEPFFAGHFPKQPVMPGVLIIEFAAQASLLLTMLQQHATQPLMGYLVKTKDFTFYSVAEPGIELEAKVKMVEKMGSYYTTQATIKRVDSRKKVAKGELVFYLTEEGKESS
ncbi:3-hydroxyacyl-ACP dehydratase FabZ family protein [Halalkalibacter alkalisediminis]|uniref:3-hydroxyacyl-ACP dehydratase FabZ family protein n=1 Tax=Halalkalibacter alkalisediminis TaxID=935616 RepID=A0ABV6NP35_9BACI|nr:3-hydroxyacyl-ACP dehydratase FabZ family protein [Halalkalibacter alkalisediminis]